jgi:hypothetical protein
VIEARRPRLTQAEKDTIAGGGVPSEWKPARRAQIDRDGRWTIKRGRKREAAPGAGHKRQIEIAVQAFATRTTSALIAPSAFCAATPSPMRRLTTAVSSAPCLIGTTPRARCGPTPPTARPPTSPSSSAGGGGRNSSAKSPAASRCRRISSAAMPPGPGALAGRARLRRPEMPAGPRRAHRRHDARPGQDRPGQPRL